MLIDIFKYTQFAVVYAYACVFVSVCVSEMIRENGGVFLTAGTLRTLHPAVSLFKPFKSTLANTLACAAAGFNQNHS